MKKNKAKKKAGKAAKGTRDRPNTCLTLSGKPALIGKCSNNEAPLPEACEPGVEQARGTRTAMPHRPTWLLQTVSPAASPRRR